MAHMANTITNHANDERIVVEGYFNMKKVRFDVLAIELPAAVDARVSGLFGDPLQEEADYIITKSDLRDQYAECFFYRMEHAVAFWGACAVSDKNGKRVILRQGMTKDEIQEVLQSNFDKLGAIKMAISRVVSKFITAIK